MRSFLLLSVILLQFFSLQAQQQQSTLIPKGNVYAVIVGISKYQNGVPQLDFAHKDAQVFADYLKSKAGGSVPEEHIRLLVNEDATFSAIYTAFNWLVEECKENDLVYFYFSGHGDMETTTIFQLGYLLAFNTPRFNYINNAVRIEDLNNVANTLSVKNKTKVILITDACHSGKLAGSDFRGNKLVGEQLKAIKNSEVRIASCEPDQLSNEDEGWGGGRGVFSYYLIKGLEGSADSQQDGVITVNEIKTYLNTSLANDELLSQKINKQTPVIDGVDNIKLAKVDASSVNASGSQQSAAAPQRTLLKGLGVQPQAYLFDLIKKASIEKLADFDTLGKLSREEIPFAFLRMVKDSILGPYYAEDSNIVNAFDNDKFVLLEETFRENKDALKRFNEKLVVTLSDHGQSIINLYLQGDAAELERRRYYNSRGSGYDVYPRMFAVALKLIAPDHPLYKILRIKFHYFSGVAARLKTPTVENAKPLLDLAFAEQKKALALEENAAYIQIELGIIYDYMDEYATAEKYYLRAADIAPQWAIPWSNLVRLYANTKKYDKALESSRKAIELQKDYQGVYVNTGVVYQRTGNLLFAEELFRKSIKMNSRHYLPFEGLGYAYLGTTQYEKADYFFYEADKRRQGFHNPRHMRFPKPVMDGEVDGLVASVCMVDKSAVGENDVLGNFALAMAAYLYGPPEDAEKGFKKVIKLDNTNPLAFHYLGKLLYEQKRWKEADIIFNYAENFYLDDSSFNHYYDSLASRLPETNSKDCILGYFRSNRYLRIEDNFFMGAIYETWNHFSEAEKHYRKIINADSSNVGGYYKLWMMLERIGRYKDAEEIIKACMFWNKDIGSRELNSFYGRMIKRFPNDPDWHYQAGLFLYHFANGRWFTYDRKKIEPDTDEDAFVNIMHPSLQKPGQESLQVPGTWEIIDFAKKILRPYTFGIEYLKIADSLLTDHDELADINYKIGDMYTWQGLPERSITHYKKSVDLKPSDANTRSKLVQVYSLVYYLKDALSQLDSLHQRKEINFNDQLLMAQYCIHAGRFSDATNLLKEAKEMHPFKIAEITDLNGRLRLLSNHPKEALAYYKEYLADYPGDSLTMYTIARIYAKMKNKKEAWKWLKMSIDKGFYYYYVLKMDEAWNDYRKLSQWKTIAGKVTEYRDYYDEERQKIAKAIE